MLIFWGFMCSIRILSKITSIQSTQKRYFVSTLCCIFIPFDRSGSNQVGLSYPMTCSNTAPASFNFGYIGDILRLRPVKNSLFGYCKL